MDKNYLTCEVFFYVVLSFIIFTISSSAYAQTEERRIDTILLIDVSGSMKDNDPNKYRMEAAKLFISLANNEDRIGIITFGDESNTVSDLMKLSTEEDKKKLQEKIDRIQSKDKYTNITHGLRRAYEMLRRREDKFPKGVLIMLTDGKNEISNKDEYLYGSKALENLIDDYRAKKWDIFTVGFGNAVKDTLLKISGDQEKSFYIKDTSDLPLKYFEIMRQLKHESMSAYEIIENKKYSIAIPENKEEVILYIKKEAGSVLENISITDKKGRTYKLSEIGKVVSSIYQIVRIRGIEPGKWDIKVSSRDRLIDIIFGVISTCIVFGIFIVIFVLYRLNRSYSLRGTIRIIENINTRIEKLKGKEMFLNLGIDEIYLKNSKSDSTIAKLSVTKNNDYRIKLEIIGEKGCIMLSKKTSTSWVKLVEKFDYHLKNQAYSFILNYFKNNPNPFTPDNPIRGEMFAEREEVIKVVNNFKSSNPPIYLLLGPLYSGKTSIIQQIERELQKSHYCIKVDITEVLSSMRENENILGNILAEICQKLPDHEKKHLDEMRRISSPYLLKNNFLGAFNKIRGKQILISIDESFERLQKNAHVFQIQHIEEIAKFFKELGNSSLCIIISYPKIESAFYLSSDKEDWERMKKYCEFVKVGGLEPQAAEELIGKIIYYCPALKIKENVIAKIQDLTGGHPYFIQLLCSTVITYCNQEGKVKLSEKDIEKCIQLILKDTKVNLNFWSFWQNLTNIEKVFLIAAVELGKKDYPPDSSAFINFLEEYKVNESVIKIISSNFNLLWEILSEYLLLQKEGDNVICAPLYERWIRENIDFDPILKTSDQ